MFPVPVPTTRPATREALDEMVVKLDSVFRQIRDKAFEGFVRRGSALGSELEDWFAAERELFRLPLSEMKLTDTEVQIRAAVPGFRAEDLHVQVLPELIVVEGKTAESPEKPAEATKADQVVFNEFTGKRLFRQYKLASPIDVNEVQATLDKGILQIVARRKAVETKAIEVPVHTELVVAPPTALAATAK